MSDYTIKDFEKIKNHLETLKTNNDKALNQEEFILNQLKEQFEVESMEESYLLLKQFTEERDEYKILIENKMNNLISLLKKDELI